jgi:cytochrome c-type biogenesis protein CcmE
MNRSQQRRAWLIGAVIAVVSAVIVLALIALRNNIDLYYTPSELKKATLLLSQTIRVGGWVKPHSVHYSSGQRIEFVLTDHQEEVWVRYRGLLPSLFREGQGIVVSGHRSATGEILALQVLAKHDENYHPPKLIDDRLRKSA